MALFLGTRVSIEWRGGAKKSPPRRHGRAGGGGEVGGALLSRAPGRSIIAAGALNGRVRDGDGCLSPAGAANQGVSAQGRCKADSAPAEAPPPPRPRPRRSAGAVEGGRAGRTAYQNPSAERVAALAPGACQPGSLPGAFRGSRLGRRVSGGAWRLDAFSAYPFATWLPGRADRLDNRRTRGRPPPVLSY